MCFFTYYCYSTLCCFCTVGYDSFLPRTVTHTHTHSFDSTTKRQVQSHNLYSTPNVTWTLTVTDTAAKWGVLFISFALFSSLVSFYLIQPFPQMLFAPRRLCYRRWSHCSGRNFHWSKTPPLAELIGSSSVRACSNVLRECVVKLECKVRVWGELCVCVRVWPPSLAGVSVSIWSGWSLQSTQPSIDPRALICTIQRLTASLHAPHIRANGADACKQASTQTTAATPLTINNWCNVISVHKLD